MSTHKLCFRAKIRKNVYPCKHQFYYIKVGCKRVFITRTCFRDDKVKLEFTGVNKILLISALKHALCVLLDFFL